MADDKYITFRRSDFFIMMGFLALPPWTDENGQLIGENIDCAPLAALIQAEAAKIELADAVVIRRQDLFASPALATYAAMIAIVTKREQDPVVKQSLLDIADYFERQGELAAAEGYKLPDV